MAMRQDEAVSGVNVIGAGLAGSEAAWQIALRGVKVDLYEMRPERLTPAHTTGGFAELVCSNSLGSEVPHAASRILKDELEALGGLVLKLARATKVPAGASLAVDRREFSERITRAIEGEPLITIHRAECPRIPAEAIVVVATGPLTSESLAADLRALVGQESLYFYDAISPIVSADSLDLSKMYLKNRYDKGESADFLNIPLEKAQYEELVGDLLSGDVVLPHAFEEERYFEGCMPVEALAARGFLTLAHGPLKPVGLERPETGRRPYAAIQLRTENAHRTAYNLVGFQTKLKYGEQERILRKLPGLERAEFLRLGSMHRNTYIHSPRLLQPTLQLRNQGRILIAGQLTGTEGYLESSATGLVAGMNAARLARGEPPLELPPESMLGALLATITDASRKNFQPLNANMGILPPLPTPTRDRAVRNQLFSERSRVKIGEWIAGQRGLVGGL